MGIEKCWETVLDEKKGLKVRVKRERIMINDGMNTEE